MKMIGDFPKFYIFSNHTKMVLSIISHSELQDGCHLVSQCIAINRA